MPTVDFHRDDPGRMLEMLGEEEIGLTAIDRLNELLEAERAGVDALSRLFPEARSPEMQKLFEEVRNHEAWSWREHLEEMKTRHVTNIEACEQLAESLKAA